MSCSAQSIFKLQTHQIVEVIRLLEVHACVTVSFGQLLRYCLEKDSDAFIAIDNQMIVGVLGGRFFPDKGEATIDMLCVHTDYRGCGWAKMLLNKYVEVHGHGISYILDVRLSNKVAQELYKRQGFVTCGRKPLYYSKEDSLTMILQA